MLRWFEFRLTDVQNDTNNERFKAFEGNSIGVKSLSFIKGDLIKDLSFLIFFKSGIPDQIVLINCINQVITVF